MWNIFSTWKNKSSDFNATVEAIVLLDSDKSVLKINNNLNGLEGFLPPKQYSQLK